MEISFFQALLRAALEQTAGPSSAFSAYTTIGMIVAGITIISAAYQLGRWRERGTVRDERMLAELARMGKEQATSSAGTDRRLKVLERLVNLIVTQNAMRLATNERWRGQAETRLDSHDRRLGVLEGDRLEVVA